MGSTKLARANHACDRFIRPTKEISDCNRALLTIEILYLFDVALCADPQSQFEVGYRARYGLDTEPDTGLDTRLDTGLDIGPVRLPVRLPDVRPDTEPNAGPD